MSIIVSFMKPGSMGSVAAVGVGEARATEVLTLGSGVTTTGAGQNGEFALVLNTETSAVLGARGATPNAAATSLSATTDAGFPIPAGQLVPVALRAGDKLNFKPQP